MDEPLLRILQSIKRIEDDPSMQFQTEEINLATFIPKYKNVIVVDQRCDPSQLSVREEALTSPQVQSTGKHFTTNQLSKAFELALHYYLRTEESSEWTFVLREGLFINPLNELGYLTLSKQVFSEDWGLDTLPPLMMEIVGLQDVRILLTHDSFKTFSMGDTCLIMRNIRIYDYRQNPCETFPMIQVDGDCHLEEVKMFAPKARGIDCTGPGSKVCMKGCSFSVSTLYVSQGVVRAQNCLIKTRRHWEVRKGATLFANHVYFHAGIACKFNSRTVLDECEFCADDESVSKPALNIDKASEVDCRRTTFFGMACAVMVIGSGSSALFRHCNFLLVLFPSRITQNANLLLADSLIQSHFLLCVTYNKRGKWSCFGTV